MRELSHSARNALGNLSRSPAGLYEGVRFSDRMDVAASQILALECKRVLIVAPAEHHGAWTAHLRGVVEEAGLDSMTVSSVRSHKAEPPVWRESMKRPEQPGIWIITWENMRGQIPASMKSSKKVVRRDVLRCMGEGTIPPWDRTGVWDLVIADDSDHMAFRHTLQANVIKMIDTRNKLALSDCAEGSHPEGLWSTLNWLWPSSFGGYWNWARERFQIEEKTMGKAIRFMEIGDELFPNSRWYGVPCFARD